MSNLFPASEAKYWDWQAVKGRQIYGIKPTEFTPITDSLEVGAAPVSSPNECVIHDVGFVKARARVPAMTPHGCGGLGQASPSESSTPSPVPVGQDGCQPMLTVNVR